MPRKPGRPAKQLHVDAFAKMEAIKEELRLAIRASGLSEREIARQLGYGPAYLANLFGQAKSREPAGLRIDTCLALLEVLGIDARTFFDTTLRRLEQGEGPSSSRASLDYTLALLERQLDELAERGATLPAPEAQGIAKTCLKVVRRVVVGLAGAER